MIDRLFDNTAVSLPINHYPDKGTKKVTLSKRPDHQPMSKIGSFNQDTLK